MNATNIAVVLQIAGWGLFFYTVRRLRVEQWRRGPLLLFWCSTALLGCSTFCFAAAPLLGWGQIAWLMLTGAIASVAVAAIWGALTKPVRVGTQKAADTAQAATPHVGGWAVPSFSDMLGGAPQWDSATIAGIEAMEVA